MRIVHLAKHCRDANGNVNVAIDLACAQVAGGDEVVFASAGGILEPLLVQRGVAIARIVQEGGALDIARNLAQFVKFCRKFRPDIIHAHMVSSAIFGLAAARLTGAKLVTTVHNSFDRQSALMRVGDAVIAVSEAERQLLAKRGFAASKLTCILNGPAGSAREALAEAGERPFASPCVTMVCGLHARKGVDDMIAAFLSLGHDFPDWHLNLIGDGPDREKLAERIVRDELDRVHLVGAVPHPKPYLEKSEIFATCSYAEPFALSTLEARAAGCAIIGSRVGGTPEALEQGKAGLLFEAGNRDELASHLRLLMGDAATRTLWRARAKEGSDHFRIARMEADHRSLYLALIERKGVQRPLGTTARARKGRRPVATSQT